MQKKMLGRTKIYLTINWNCVQLVVDNRYDKYVQKWTRTPKYALQRIVQTTYSDNTQLNTVSQFTYNPSANDIFFQKKFIRNKKKCTSLLKNPSSIIIRHISVYIALIYVYVIRPLQWVKRTLRKTSKNLLNN